MKTIIRITLGIVCLGCLIFIFCGSWLLGNMLIRTKPGHRIGFSHKVAYYKLSMPELQVILGGASLAAVCLLIAFIHLFEREKWSSGYLGFIVIVILTLIVNKGCGIIF